MNLLRAGLVSLGLVVAVSSCDAIPFEVDVNGFPMCPTTIEVYLATPLVPLGCPLPPSPADTLATPPPPPPTPPPEGGGG